MRLRLGSCTSTARYSKGVTLKNKVWLSIGMAAVGVGLLAASAFAGAASSAPQAAKKASAKGGTLRVDSRSDFDYVEIGRAHV